MVGFFRQAHVGAAMIHVLRRQWGECRLPLCVNISDVTARLY